MDGAAMNDSVMDDSVIDGGAKKSTSVKYPIPQRRNVAIVIAQIAAVAGCCWWARNASGWAELLGLATVFGVLMNSVYSVIHEAEHGILLNDRRLNDATGVGMALLFPAPFHLIRQGHLGHHVRNRSDDEAFDYIFPGEHPAWKRLQLYGIITGFYWAIVALGNVVVMLAPFTLVRKNFEFDKPSAAFMESLNPRYWSWIRWEACAAIVLHVGVVWSTAIPVLNYVIMYSGFGFMWSAMQYVHHFGTERHVWRGSRNLWIFAPLDWIWLHHNWHQTHHHHPSIPWVHLPQLGREENPERGFLPWAYFRMWRGPRHAKESVRNRYAGRTLP